MTSSYAQNPDYPFPSLLPVLRIEHTPAEYTAVVAQLSYHQDKRATTEGRYLNFLPNYIYARCPICKEVCHEPIDTYSLPSNYLKNSAAGPFFRDYPDAYPVPCKHYLGTHSFLNLHDQTPTFLDLPDLLPTRDSVSITFGEIPYVSDWLLDEPSSYVVMHALPVCAIEDETFVPRYTRYILTYFHNNPAQLISRIYREHSNEEGEVPWLTYRAYDAGSKLPPPSTNLNFMKVHLRKHYEPLYDLQNWASEGKLGWLDYASPELPLKLGRGLTLPAIYHEILGRRYGFRWSTRSDGTLEMFAI
jgi:hypothetical protein